MNSEQEYRQPMPGAAAQPASVAACGSGEVGYCITCSDEALPARVLNVDTTTGLALVEAMGITTEIDATLVEAVTTGDWLLVHGGVAIARAEEAGDG